MLVGQLGELFLLLFLFTQVSGLRVLPMPFSPVTFWIGFLFTVGGAGMSFMGKGQLGSSWHYAGGVKETKKLVITGLYKYVRHPIYGGYILSFVGIELLLGSYLWVSFLGLFIPFLLQIHKEEVSLEKRFGILYKEYKRKTKSVIPFIW